MAATDADNGRTARFSQILARLQELPTYTWNTDIEPFHSVSCALIVATTQADSSSRTTTGISLDIKRPPRNALFRAAGALHTLASRTRTRQSRVDQRYHEATSLPG